MSENVLRLDHITMQFGGVVAVNDLSMEVNKGEIVALIGPNGAGKTTAFNTITGVYEPTNGAYGASKIAATGLTRGWGKRFASEGIVINGIAPGPVATEMNGWHEGDPMEHDRIPFGRFATIDEIASLAMHLLSKEAEMICGETVVLDGAYAIR